MGIGAYNRGSRAISAEIDRELQEKRAPVSFDSFEKVRIENERLRADNVLLEGQLDKATATIREIAEGLNRLQKLIEESSRRRRHLTELWRAARKRECVYEARWRWVSSIVRACVSPARVQEFRDDPYEPTRGRRIDGGS